MTEPLETWIGRTRTQNTLLAPEMLGRYAAAIGASQDAGAALPPLAQWAFFNDTVASDHLGPDGHPHKGLFLPPVALPRRMFAAASFRFEVPLKLGEPAELVSTIADVRRRSGRSGELVFVEVERRLSQEAGLRLTELQTLVYRDAGEATAPVPETDQSAGEVWTPGPVDLFRFSAATYNSHRIHYDHAYATGVEGYPGLVVHGPFTAAKLCGLAASLAAKPLTAFSFRAMSPLFVGQPVRLRAGDEPASLVAIRCDGAVAMSATYEV
jgi:3-methylfumaryl-CoA hydratase